MMMDHFIRVFRYDAWANRKTLAALKQVPDLHERPRQVMAHLLMSQKVWLTRLRGEDTSAFTIWPEAKPDEWEALLEDNSRGYQALLGSLTNEGLAKEIHYFTSNGLEFRTAVVDILTQVLLHSSYHRGQLAIAIKQQGGSAPVTDFIIYLREEN